MNAKDKNINENRFLFQEQHSKDQYAVVKNKTRLNTISKALNRPSLDKQ